MHDIQGLKESTRITAFQRYFSFEISGGPERTEFCVFGGKELLKPSLCGYGEPAGCPRACG